MYILGISCFYHDSAACLSKDGLLIAATQEERFTRIKHDESFPEKSIDFCLQKAGISIDQLDSIVFYDKPFLKFERILETYLATAPKGFSSFLKAVPVWMREKLWTKSTILKKLSFSGPVYFCEHHMSHAASAFFPSPFSEAVIITADGVGEWATTSISVGKQNKIEILKEIHFPHSLGLLYSAFTYYTGFKVNSGEYKVMGLAPYGKGQFTQAILDHVIDIADDGSFKLNMAYFNYLSGLTMTSKKFNLLFGGPPRKPESPISQREMDLAKSVQEVTELIMKKLVSHAMDISGLDKVCMAGGVALNCVSNGKLIKELPIKDIFIQPASGDAGGALGASLYGWYQIHENKRQSDEINDKQRGSFLGPEFKTSDIEKEFQNKKRPLQILKDDEWASKLSNLLLEEKIIGLLQGPMEFGPRALGGRSILGDPRSSAMQKIMNLKIKYRESFRPFAPIMLEEDAKELFDSPFKSPYMLIVAELFEKHRLSMTDEQKKLFGIELLNIPRSKLPAITHVDYTARLQTIDEKNSPRIYSLLKAFKKQTGFGVLVNTSFNVRGEPIVCNPEDAYRCFMRTEMDYLVLENCLFDKKEQPKFDDKENWQNEFKLD